MNNKRQNWRALRFALQTALSVAVAVAAFGVHPCLAANIPALLNTGVDNAGVPLAEGDLDANWEIILIDAVNIDPNPIPPEDPFVQDQSGGFPIGPWLDDASDFDGDVPSDSRWITPSLDTNGPEADYHFEITFDLSLFDASTAIINGGWSTDNPGVDIIVNGTSTGQTAGGFTSWSAFDIPTNLLLPGENSIVFIAQNAAPDDNPAGVRVDFAVKEADPVFLLGDFNNDTMIDTLDFEIMLANFLTGTTHAQGDMQLNNNVDLDDFNLFVDAFNDFNGGGAPTSIPEPGALVLAAMALMLLPCGPRLWRRR